MQHILLVRKHSKPILNQPDGCNEGLISWTLFETSPFTVNISPDISFFGGSPNTAVKKVISLCSHIRYLQYRLISSPLSPWYINLSIDMVHFFTWVLNLGMSFGFSIPNLFKEKNFVHLHHILKLLRWKFMKKNLTYRQELQIPKIYIRELLQVPIKTSNLLWMVIFSFFPLYIYRLLSYY